MNIQDVDLTNLEYFAAHQGYAMFDVLREKAPVFWNPEGPPNRGFWAVTRHADIQTVDRDADTFTSEKFVNLEEVDDELMEIRRSILETDGTRHRALRKLLHRDLGAQNLKIYEDFLRELTKVTLDGALVKGSFDFVKEVSADFPIRVLARMLDVPDSETNQLVDWGNRIVANTDPEYADVLLQAAESERYKHLPFRSPASLEVFAYGNELRRKRLGGSGDDLISKLVNRIPDDGVALDEKDFNNYFLLLVVAGNETTRHAISHTLLALIEHPEQLEVLQCSPELIPDAVEEFLRWASPVYHFRRTATRDIEMEGRLIKAGDKVTMWFASGNRDSSVFVDPYAFDVTRKKVDHLTFGKGGAHFCMGNALARMELRVMFEELIPRIGSIALVGEPARVQSNFVNGLKRLPVSIRIA